MPKLKAFDVARKMPPLRHLDKRYGKTEPRQSDVIRWLVHQPSIQRYVFGRAYREGMIRYDKYNECYVGVDYEGDCSEVRRYHV